VKDVPAYLNRAIEEDWGGAWDIERKKEEVRKKNFIETEKAKKTEEAKKKKDGELRYKAILRCFYNMAERMQAITKQNFIDSIKGNSFVLNEWKKAEKEGKNPIEKPLIRGSFVQFLIEKNICVTD
jgi:hypothetical protein